ncbi:type 1 fimbrial protein [Andreprevotia chitinilytica]|uniref:type 1 fimbrial protein n=1 Tax=Andreprevotia chitinilytica TaxID=396808 RepID=UPI000556A0CF|nr:type 1 fimbrial protein [Andreprevotia chitinilytica]
MKVRKTLLQNAVVLLVLAGAQSAFGADGTIRFTGQVVEGGCQVSYQGGATEPQLSGCRPHVAASTQISLVPVQLQVTNTSIIPPQTGTTSKPSVVLIEYL